MPTRWSSIALFILGIGLIVLLRFTGSREVVDPLNIQDDAATPAGSLSGATTIGQTFVAHSPHLSAIQILWIVSDDFSFAPDSRVTLHLRQRVDDASDLVAILIPLDQIQHNQFTTFHFAPLADSQDQAYYFFCEVSRAEITRGWFSIWSSDDDTLPDGRMYLDGIATDRDLVFRTFTSLDFLTALDAFRTTAARQAEGLPVAALLFLIPGLVLGLSFRVLRLRSGASPQEISAETLAMIGGASLATWSAAALVVLWLGISVSWLLVESALLVVIAILVIRNCGYDSPQPTTLGRDCREMLLLGGLALLSLVVGFIQFAELPVPLWVDSFAHAAYIKFFLDEGHLPLNQIYHFGFHSIVALVVQLSGLSIPQAMVLVGQLVVVQIGLSFFLLGKRMTGSAVGGFAGAICVWFLTPTPPYFLTWGRYPLLIGTAILPLALVAALDWIELPRFEWRAYFFAIVMLAGLAFAHIRLLAFYVVFVAFFLIAHNLCTRRWGVTVGRVMALAVIGLLIGVIWFAALATFSSVALSITERVETPSGIDVALAFAVMQSHYGLVVWALVGIGCVVAVARRSWGVGIIVAGYVALLTLAALQRSLGGVVLLEMSFVVLMGFFPAVLIVGELAHVVYQQTCKTFGDLSSLAWLGVGLLVSLLGAREMLSIVNPTTILFTRADERAMTWIQAHTPNDARLLVNSFAWYPTYYVPSDGGGWIPPITNREIVFVDSAITTDGLARWIATQEITHVYIGRRAGVLHARDFTDAPEQYELVYDEEGVRIWQVKTKSVPLSNPR